MNKGGIYDNPPSEQTARDSVPTIALTNTLKRWIGGFSSSDSGRGGDRSLIPMALVVGAIFLVYTNYVRRR